LHLHAPPQALVPVLPFFVGDQLDHLFFRYSGSLPWRRWFLRGRRFLVGLIGRQHPGTAAHLILPGTAPGTACRIAAMRRSRWVKVGEEHLEATRHDDSIAE